MGLSFLDIGAFADAPLSTDPFCYAIVPEFVRREALEAISADYPDISMPGSFPLCQLKCGPAFHEFVRELASAEFREAFEQKFKIDLAGRPTAVTARGRCAARDGRIHTDSTNKLITVLIYVNSSWEALGGRLRLLRSGDDLEDAAAEVLPIAGTMLAFRRANNSWHGHKPFVGPRRVVQFNWITSEKDQRIVMLRHFASAAVKRMVAALVPDRRPS